jgi:UDP-N-acetylglucosamine 1-carboxyvinyltransferase
MDKIIITGGSPLNGDIPISGAKNAALPLMCASLLTDRPFTLKRVPNLRDINSLNALLESLGTKVSFNGDVLDIDPSGVNNTTAAYDLVRKMRASVLVLGPLVARHGNAKVSLPGGCAIGTRPVDLHLSALEKLGCKIDLDGGYINANAPDGLKGAKITFPKVSVGATENIMMAAVLAKGTTVLANAAREPEITDLGECLISMGAKISGLGTDTITIEGVETLNGTEHAVVADRIEAGTYMIAAAMAGGRVNVTQTRPEHLDALIDPMRKAGIDIDVNKDVITISRDASKKIQAVDIMTEPYPGFPTDLQAQLMAMLTIAEGAGMVTETIFENRFMHVPELTRMGANITIHQSSALVRGVDQLHGAEVMATDLRASVSLVLAGLVAEGETTVNRIYHLERGYEKLVEKLSACGATLRKAQ